MAVPVATCHMPQTDAGSFGKRQSFVQSFLCCSYCTLVAATCCCCWSVAAAVIAHVVVAVGLQQQQQQQQADKAELCWRCESFSIFQATLLHSTRLGLALRLSLCQLPLSLLRSLSRLCCQLPLCIISFIYLAAGAHANFN